jgi:hypothetical protein
MARHVHAADDLADRSALGRGWFGENRRRAGKRGGDLTKGIRADDDDRSCAAGPSGLNRSANDRPAGRIRECALWTTSE